VVEAQSLLWKGRCLKEAMRVWLLSIFDASLHGWNYPPI
jgi:hypothetical protein